MHSQLICASCAALVHAPCDQRHHVTKGVSPCSTPPDIATASCQVAARCSGYSASPAALEWHCRRRNAALVQLLLALVLLTSGTDAAWGEGWLPWMHDSAELGKLSLTAAISFSVPAAVDVTPPVGPSQHANHCECVLQGTPYCRHLHSTTWCCGRRH